MAVTVIAGLASAGGAWAAAGFAAMSFGAIAGAFAIGAGLSLVSRALIGKPSFAAGSALKGTGVTVREPDATRKLIYGRVRVGGAVVFLDSSGTDNKYMNLVVAIAGHEVDGIEEIWFNDELIWDGSFKSNWADFVSFNFHDGSQTTADADLVAESIKWTTDHILNDTAYLYVKMEYDVEQFPQGMPNISALIRGKKIYNPVTDVTEWTQNSALCVYDYLIDSKYGLSESASSVNLASLTQAIALCSDQVDLGGGQSHDRYTLNGVIDTGNSRKDNMEAMLTSMAGNLIYSGGEYFISGASYSAPTVTFDESVLVGGIEVQTKQSRRGLYNGVKGVFLSEEDNYIVADYPAQISSQYSLDDGDPIYLDMALPFTTNNVRAQRIAKIALLRSRKQTAISMPCNLAALKVKAGDNINVSNAKMGWSNKPFEVIGYELTFDSSGSIIVNINAIETSAEIYDWQSSDAIDYLNSGELSIYDGKQTAAPQNLIATPSSTVNADGTVTPSIDLSWTASVDAFVDQYIVEWTNTTSGSGVFSSNTNTNTFSVAPVVPNNLYNISVYAINGLGVKSTALTGSATSVADAAPNLPSIYKIVTDSSDAPTAQQFLDSSGRNPKNNDYAITSDTTTDPDTTYAWRYDLSTSSWVSDSYLISGDLIVTGSINTQLLTVGVNESLQSADTALQDSDTGVNLGLTGGSIAGITISPTAIYSGAGNFNNADTGFYLGSDSSFSLDNKLSFNPSTDTLTVDGAIKAINLDLTGNATIAGSLTATGIVYGGVTLEMLNQEVIDSFQNYVAQASGGTPGDYETGSATAPATITLGDFTHGEQPVEITVTANNTGYHYVNYTTADLTANYVVERAVSGTTTWSSVGSGVMVFSQYDLTEYYPDTYYHSLGHTNSITDDPADGTYTYRLRFTSYGSAWSSIGPSVSLAANENGTAATSSGGNADTLDYLDSTQFMRSDANTSTSGNLTVGGDLTVNGTTVTLNTATLDVEDKNITLNFGAGDTSASANGAGITIQDAVNSSTDASILWNTSTDTFNFSNGIDVTGTATMGGLNISSTGNNSFTQTHTDGNTVIFTQSGTGGDVQWRNANGGALINTAATNRALFASNGDVSFYEDTGTTPKFFWDASAESLGIGTSSIAAGTKLQVAGETRIYPDSGTATLRFGSGGVEKGKFSVDASSNMAFETAGSERMRIDSSGDMIMKGGRIKVRENDDGNDAVVITRDADEGYVNLYSAGLQTIEIRGNGNSYFNGGNVLVGTTSTGLYNTTTNTGVQIDGVNANIAIARSGGRPIDLNRLASDGEIARFSKDGAAVGSIGSAVGNAYFAGTASGITFGSANIYPTNNSGIKSNGTLVLGHPNNRFKDFYLSGFSTAGSYQVNGTTVIDSSRNLTNIGTISSGSITTSGNLNINTANDGLYFLGTNNRIYFNNNRAMEGNSDGSLLAIAEGYITTQAYSNFSVSSGHNIQINGTTVIDSSRNLTNIGTIGASDIYTTTLNTGTPWTSANDGSGSGLDADLLDGLQPSQLSVSSSIATDYLNSVNYATDYSSNLIYWQASGLDTNYAPDTSWYNTIRGSHGGGVSYYSNTLAMQMTGGVAGTIFTQTRQGGSLSGWNRFWHSNNDGAGSGLDADLLDGQQASAFALAVHGHTGLGVSDWNGIKSVTPYGYIQFGPANTSWAHIYSSGMPFYFNTNLYVNGSLVWNAANDGAGSGLDADLLDGQQGSYYAPASRTYLPTAGNYVWNANSAASTYNVGLQTSFVRSADSWPDYGAVLHVGARGGGDAGGDFQIYCGHGATNGGNYLRVRNADNSAVPSDSWTAWRTIWDSGNDGSGSGLDADLLDGINSGSFLRSDDGDTATQRIRFSANETNNWDTIATSTGGLGSLEVYNYGSGNDAFMSFHAGGDFALYFGLDATTNDIAVGGWSMGAAKYRVWHAGNDGSGSGLDADLLDGRSSSIGASAYTIVLRDGNGHIYSNYILGSYFNASSGNSENPTIGQIWTQNTSDNYLRKSTPAHFANQMSGYFLRSDAANTLTLTMDAAGNNYETGASIISIGVLSSSTSYNYHMVFKDANGTVKGRITNNTYGTQYTTSSDYRLKEDIQPVEDATSRILDLNVRNFLWSGTDCRTDGFLAHELAEVVPEAVVGEKDAVLEDGTPNYQTVDQTKLIPLLVKTIQELEARIKLLENN